MHSYVLVVNSPYSEETDNEIPAHCDKGTIRSGLPARCGYTSENDLDELEDDDIFGEFSPRMTRSLGQIDVQLSVKEVRKYLLDFLQSLKKEIQARAHDSLSLCDAASALRGSFDLRIQDGAVQYDATLWLYGKLVEADKSKAEYISFTIDQVYYCHY